MASPQSRVLQQPPPCPVDTQDIFAKLTGLFDKYNLKSTLTGSYSLYEQRAELVKQIRLSEEFSFGYTQQFDDELYEVDNMIEEWRHWSFVYRRELR